MPANTLISPGSLFAYLPEVLDKHTTSKGLVTACYSAALANFARDRFDGQLMRFARKMYLNAIKHVNLALKSPKDMACNSTLVAVLIMGLFEAITFEDHVSLRNWMAHTNGTLSLLTHRGDDFLCTPFGKQIYLQVANRIRANCINLAKPLPDNLVELDRRMTPYLNEKEHPMLAFWPLKIHKLQAMSRNPHLYTPVETIMFAADQDALQLEAMKKVVSLLTPHGLSFDHPPKESFKKIAFLRKGTSLIRFLSSIHLSRLVKCEIIHQQIGIMKSRMQGLGTAADAWTDLQKTAERLGLAAAEAILACLPIYLYPDPKDPKGHGPLSTIVVIPLVWPLSCFARSRLATPEQRDRAQDALMQIGQRARLPIASALAENFKHDAMPLEQLHLLHLQ
jgi:Fungal specific transcription factor domain